MSIEYVNALKQDLMVISEDYIEIEDEDDFQSAGKFLQTIKQFKSKVSDTFDPIIKSAHNTWKEAINQRKTVEQPILDAEKKIRFKMSQYSMKLKEKEEQEKKELMETAEELNHIGEFVPPPMPVKKETPKGISTREKWSFEIKDETQIPREYLFVDVKKIGGVVRALKQATNIPGIAVFKEEVISVR